MKKILMLSLALFFLVGCTKEPGSTKLTEGKLRIECDESVFPRSTKWPQSFVTNTLMLISHFDQLRHGRPLRTFSMTASR